MDRVHSGNNYPPCTPSASSYAISALPRLLAPMLPQHHRPRSTPGRELSRQPPSATRCAADQEGSRLRRTWSQAWSVPLCPR